MTDPNVPTTIIALGRAYVRMIEAARVIAAAAEADAEEMLMAELVADYTEGLRRLQATLPPHVMAEIWLASDRILGPVNETGLN